MSTSAAKARIVATREALAPLAHIPRALAEDRDGDAGAECGGGDARHAAFRRWRDACDTDSLPTVIVASPRPRPDGPILARTNYASVDAYLAAQPEYARSTLEAVRSAIRAALPSAEEMISYQIPAYRVSGGMAIFFAGWKKHYSLYPVSEALLDAFGEELEPFEVERGTIRFPLGEPVPAGLIGRIAAFKAEEASDRARARKRR